MNNRTSYEASLFKTILDENEEVLWADKPQHIPYLASGLLFLIIGCLWGAMDFLILTSAKKGNAGPVGLFFFIHAMPFHLSVLNMLRLILSYKNVHYAITNRRILLRSGLFGIGYEAIDYDKVRDIQVTIGPLEALAKSGSILLNTGQTSNRGIVWNRMVAIEEPYEVFKKIKEVSMNIKSDLNYPNALRPESNPGYPTKYTGS